MGYVVRKLSNKKGRQWKVQLRTDIDGQRKESDIPTDQLVQHGFFPEMTLEQAKERATLQNKDAEIKRHAERKNNIQKRLEKEAIQALATFPDEAEFITWAAEHVRFASIKSNKFNSHWHCTKKLVSVLGIKPTQYADKKQRLYDWFKDNQLSMSYIQKIVRLMNLYGRFHAKKYKVYVEELPVPTGYHRSDIEDKYFEKHPEGLAAKELTISLLESSKSKFTLEHYNWLYLSLWLGLRPSEVDGLKTPSNYRTEVIEGVTVIWVYQPKLRKLPRPKRWKPIPLVEPEQKVVLDIIQSASFKSPLAKTIRAHLGRGYNRYSGRKGFEALMRDRGHPLENVSQWLGHQSLDRTWKNYVNKGIVRFKKPAA